MNFYHFESQMGEWVLFFPTPEAALVHAKQHKAKVYLKYENGIKVLGEYVSEGGITYFKNHWKKEQEENENLYP